MPVLVDRSDRGAGRVHVVGVLIGAVWVVGDHDLRAVLLDQGADPVHHILERDIAERVGAVPVLPLGHS